MPASAYDVYRACYALSERSLQEGRNHAGPVSICWSYSAHAVITMQSASCSSEADANAAEPKDICIPGLSGNLDKKLQALDHEPQFATASGWQADLFDDVDRSAIASAAALNNGGQKIRRPARCRVSQMTLATSLASMESKDPTCVIYVRQIQKLGLRSADILRKHYEQYGKVDDVQLSNAHERLKRVPFRVRLRPSGIGMVVMRKSKDAAAAIAVGEVQMVNNVAIRVRRFEPRDNQWTPCESATKSTKDCNGYGSDHGSETSCPLTTATSFASLDEDIEHVSASSLE